MPPLSYIIHAYTNIATLTIDALPDPSYTPEFTLSVHTTSYYTIRIPKAVRLSILSIWTEIGRV
jgi:hypothetical protein